MEAFMGRQWRDAHFHFGDKADPTLGAQDHLADVRAGTGGGNRGDVQRAFQGFDAAPGKQLLNTTVTE